MIPIVIIPAAGLSRRYNGEKPKWMRTHPDGRLMINHAIDTFASIDCDIYLITTEEICENFSVKPILAEACKEIKDVISLKKQTNSAVETIIEGLKIIGIDVSANQPIFIKDSDNFVEIEWDSLDLNESFTVGYDLSSHDIAKLSNKSFIIRNDLGYVTDFVEKKIISEVISVGTHYINSASTFILHALEIMNLDSKESQELYVSHVISSSIYSGDNYKLVLCDRYIDFGTQSDWDKVQNQFRVIFSDFDGTLVKNKAKYGINNWFERNDIPLVENIDVLKKIYEIGGQIVITTARCESEKEYIKGFLNDLGIIVKDVITDLNHSPRIIINDFAYSNPYPSCLAINLPRNENLNEYLD